MNRVPNYAEPPARARPIPDRRPWGVLGGGILGLASALLLARAGHDVVLLERSQRLWSGASAAGEGKIHLGSIYALGNRETWKRMLTGGLEFATVIESALGRQVDWEASCSDEFLHLVSPGSLADADDLRQLYREINRGITDLPNRRYLGREIDYVVDPSPTTDEATGLPAFRCSERSVDPDRLGAMLVEAVTAHPKIEVRTGSEVAGVDTEAGIVTTRDAGGSTDASEPFERVLNCTWEQRQAIEAASGQRYSQAENLRIKACLRLKRLRSDRSVTLVQGPFGDVVAHRDYTYASWYPVGRTHVEHSTVPSDEAARGLDNARGSMQLAERQHEALAALGVLDSDAKVIGHDAGFILGQGKTDIDSPDSPLHSREKAGSRAKGRLITPINYKFSTAPLAALEACAVAGQLRGS